MKPNYSQFEPEEDYNIELDESQPLSVTDAYIDFLFPTLSADENIGLFRKHNKNYYHTEFIKDKEYLKCLLNNGLKDGDTYISLSTCISKNGNLTKSAENMHKRHSLGFDFDKKDFKGKYNTIQEFSKHFRDTTGLFIHFAIDTGHGYHFYVGIEETSDISRVTSITRRFAVLSGADRINISQAQTLRLPGTLNHKDKEFPLAVNIVYRYKDESFFRYTLEYLEYRLKQLEREAGIGRPNTRRKKLTHKFKGMYPCISNMLNNGVPKGNRNKCLGRIVAYFRDCARISQNEALEVILMWNEKCNNLCEEHEHKSSEEITKDFNRYWNTENSYNLLGCISERNSFSPILIKYCDDALCAKMRVDSKKDSTQFFILDGRYATDSCLCTLKGYSYLILKVLIESKSSLKVSELVKLTGLSEQTVSRSLRALQELKFVIKSTKGIATYKARNYKKPKQQITLPIKLFELFESKQISEQELKLYITIRRNAYAGLKCTYDELAKILELNKMSIYRTVKQMETHGLLEIEHKPTGNYILLGSTYLETAYNYYIFPIEM